MENSCLPFSLTADSWHISTSFPVHVVSVSKIMNLYFCVESYDKLMIFGLTVQGDIISSYPLNSVGVILTGTSNAICDSVLSLEVSTFRPTDDSYVIPLLASLLSVCEVFF